MRYKVIRVTHSAGMHDDDTGKLPLVPRPKVALSPREPAHVVAERKPAPRRPSSFGPEIDTEELVLFGPKPRRKLSEREQVEEMAEIIQVIARIRGRMDEFIPRCGAERMAALDQALDRAATMASMLGEGLSPKREFLSRIPADLLNPVLGIYRKEESAAACPPPGA